MHERRRLYAELTAGLTEDYCLDLADQARTAADVQVRQQDIDNHFMHHVTRFMCQVKCQITSDSKLTPTDFLGWQLGRNSSPRKNEESVGGQHLDKS